MNIFRKIQIYLKHDISILTHISLSCSSTHKKLLDTTDLNGARRRNDRLEFADLGVSFHRPDCRLY
jgi:hypothetical protein